MAVPRLHPLARGSGDTRSLIVPAGDPTNFTAYLTASLGLKTSAEARGAIPRCLQAGTWCQVGYDAVHGSDTFQLDPRVANNLRWKERYKVHPSCSRLT